MGLFFLWRSQWNKAVKITLSIVFGIVFMSGMVLYKTSEELAKKPSNKQQSIAQTPVATPDPSITPANEQIQASGESETAESKFSQEEQEYTDKLLEITNTTAGYLKDLQSLMKHQSKELLTPGSQEQVMAAMAMGVSAAPISTRTTIDATSWL